MKLATLITVNQNFNKRTTLPSLGLIGAADDCTFAGNVFCKIYRRNSFFPARYRECPALLLQSGLLAIYKSGNSGYAVDLHACRKAEISVKDAYGEEVHKIKLKFSYGRLHLKIVGDEGWRWRGLLPGST